jgi:hypothetical protein
MADPTIKVITQSAISQPIYDYQGVDFTASTVMIMVQGTDNLIFNEFAVYGTLSFDSFLPSSLFLPSIPGVLALPYPTTPNIAIDQPSQFRSGQESYDSPVYGNDGDTTTVMHTDTGLNEYWYVDLGNPYNVSWITVLGSSLVPFCILFIYYCHKEYLVFDTIKRHLPQEWIDTNGVATSHWRDPH